MNPPSAFGTFRVLHQIGSGVLGPVFRAYDSQRERLVVVKAFKLDLVPEQTAAFADALRGIVARPVDDRGVVRAVDAGLAEATPFLALEFVSEDTLDAMLRESKEITSGTVVSLCRAMGRAVDAGWEVGTGHGALHPRDVFIRGADEVGITGFGVAQALQSVGMRVPVRRPYTAPERAGNDWDCRADVYSLGVIARELLARSGAPSVEVGAVLEQALAEQPADRFPTALAMADALARAVAAAPDAVSSAAAVTTNAHRPIEIDAIAESADPVADAPLRGLHEPEEAGRPIRIDAPSSIAAYAPPPYATGPRPAFPWLATVAVAVAGLSVGGLVGFRVGFSRGTDVRIERAVASVAQADSSSQPAAEPAPPPPTAQVRTNPAVPVRPRQASADVSLVSRGSLEVDSRPRGARVVVDGRAMGQTPLKVPAVSPGDHRVLIELMGHRRVTSMVKVVAGEQTRLAVSLELTDRKR